MADPSWLAKWLNPIANGALFVIMAGTILLGHPFARAYGRDTVPREFWDTPVFRKATFGISLVWALAIGAMFVGSLITAVAPSTETWSTWVVTVGALLVAIKFQAWYPRQVRAAAGLPPDGAPPTAGPPAGG